MRCVIPSDARNPGSLFHADTKTSKRNVSELFLVVDNDCNTGKEVRPVACNVELVVHGSVRDEYAERENKVVVGTDDAVLVHGGVARGDVFFDDFFGFFLEVVEGVGIEVVVCPARNDETDVCRGVVIELVAFAVFLVPADGIKAGCVMLECLLSAAKVDVVAGLFGADVVGVRVHKFIGADELFTDGSGLSYAVRRLTVDRVGFVFPVGEGRFTTGLCVVAFAVADDEHSLFIAADALENVSDVSESVGVKGDVGDRGFNAARIEFCGSCRGTGLGWRNVCGRAGFTDRSCGGAGVCVS